MALNYGPIYTSVSDITGPSGFYNIKYNSTFVTVYVDQEYSGGGWVCVLANRLNTGGMGNLTYNNAVNTSNYRTGGTTNTPGPSVVSTSGLSGLSNYNIWIGTSFWSFLGNRANPGRIDVVQFVSNTNGTALGNTGAHTKRYRWKFDYFNGTYGMVGAAGISDETGTGAPGMYAYHAANGFSLTTYDNDQDIYGPGNCSAFYANNPFWYGACWSGNYFAGGGGYVDAPYWDGSGNDYHQYGAVYIK
jgi:hypothetical protein